MNKYITDIQADLRAQSDPAKATFFPHFFVSEPGDSDQFLGVTVPKQRVIVKDYADLIPFDDVQALLHSKVHEERLTALLIWVRQYQRGDMATRKAIYDIYLKNTKWVNNWDLVDSTAYNIVGDWLLSHDLAVFEKLSVSESVWERRIAIVATLAFIRAGRFDWTLRLAEQYLDDDHHYIQKATGWMLREIGKRDPKTLEDFLNQFAYRMPRITLRYSIEKMSREQRQFYLKLKHSN